MSICNEGNTGIPTLTMVIDATASAVSYQLLRSTCV